jgi:aquaporin Z
MIARGRSSLHWREYAIEALLLATFMISASLFGVMLFHPDSPAVHAIASPLLRRCAMGAAMGLTAIALIYSPLGRRSGAHMNPATTFTFWRLGKVHTRDAIGYVVAQFLGGVGGMILAAVMLRARLAHASVDFVTTNPGFRGAPGLIAAWLGEFVIALVLMLAVLNTSNRQRLAPFTGLFAGLLVMMWIIIEAPISGTSMNPARTFGSAFTAGLLSDGRHVLWVYFTAPPMAMLAAAELYLRFGSIKRVHCAKLHHPARGLCLFRCEFHCLMNSAPPAARRETSRDSVASKATQTHVSSSACLPASDAVTATVSDPSQTREPVLAAPVWQETLHYG